MTSARLPGNWQLRSDPVPALRRGLLVAAPVIQIVIAALGFVLLRDIELGRDRR
jgi:hypothetical protein